jgi:hypothetical protein
MASHRRKRTLDGVGSLHVRPAADNFEAGAAVSANVDYPCAQVQLDSHGERVEACAEVGN